MIIEDEVRAASHLERLILKVAPDMEIIAKSESVRDSIEFLTSGNEPGLIFSDVQLADGLCFEIFRQVQLKCPIIFTTAWDHFAIEAFNTNGIDYLLKPVEEERLRKAIDKARQFSPMLSLEKILAIAGNQPAKSYKSRFLVRVGEKIKTIPVEEIITFYSLDKATYLHTNSNRSYCIDYALDQLETMLNPEEFFRISRKYIVSLKACNNITAWSNSRLKLRIDGIEDQEVIVARERVQDFRNWLDK